MINCHLGKAIDQVQQYVKADRIDLEYVEALIDILEEAFDNPNHVAEAEAKLCSLSRVTVSSHLIMPNSNATLPK